MSNRTLKNIKLLVVLSSLSFFSACATVSKFEQRMDAKKGLTKNQLIDQMGIPDKEYNAENFTILEYSQSRSGATNKNSTSVVNGVLINISTPVAYTMWCKLDFKLIGGVVESYKYRGDMCRSR